MSRHKWITQPRDAPNSLRKQECSECGQIRHEVTEEITKINYTTGTGSMTRKKVWRYKDLESAHSPDTILPWSTPKRVPPCQTQP